MTLSNRAAALLRAVHDAPGITRSDAARAIGIGTGAATEVVGQLVAAQLLAERPAAPTGGRGRPTTVLVPHERGPLVLAASITHESWELHAVELGGGTVADVAGDHTGRPGREVLTDIAVEVTRLRRRYGKRCRAIAVAAPGTVTGTVVGHATNKSWRGLDLRAIWPRAELFVAGNDATLAATAESARGAAVGTEVALHIRVQAGIGGAVVDRGRVLTGAHGFGGEFGHLPLGDPAVLCECGAHGCWGTAVDGTALARLLGRSAPRDPVAFSRRIATAARTDAAGNPVADHAAQEAIRSVAGELGKGLAGLVNAIDPDVVTIGGSGIDVMSAAPDALDAAYRAGLMRVRRADPPQLRAAALGEDGPAVGAAELGWQELLPHL